MHSSAWSAAAAALLLMTALPQRSSEESHWRQELLEWRARHATELQKPDGWLALAGLEWLAEGLNSFGAAAHNRIRVAGAPGDLGVLELQSGVVRLLPPAGGFPTDLLVAGEAAKTQALRAEPNGDRFSPHLTIGTLNMYVIRREDRFALRIKDSRSQALRGFHPLRWYEPDAHYRFEAKWIPYHPAKSVTLDTLAGTKYDQPVPGVAEFQLAGQTYRLEPVVEESHPDRLFFILRDTTSTSATYSACRFLYTAMPSRGAAQEGTLTLDFNRLENPPCAYTPYSTCPLPPVGNRLPLPLPVGERRYHD